MTNDARLLEVLSCTEEDEDQVFTCKEVQRIAQARDDASVDGYPASYDNKNQGDQRA